MKKSGTMRFVWIVLLSLLSCDLIYAHCDTKDGPVVADAREAIALNNVNYVLKWVQPADEKEIKEAFDLVMKVRVLSAEAMKLSNNYFFETLVRLHRSGEGVPYTGVKPSGTRIDEKVMIMGTRREKDTWDIFHGSWQVSSSLPVLHSEFYISEKNESDRKYPADKAGKII